MDSGQGTAPSPERARASSWGGPEAWAELRRIADAARLRAGFHVASIEVLRGDGLLELVAFTGRPEEHAAMGESFSLSYVRRVIEQGARYGRFVFLAEEDMDPELQDAIRGYGYVPAVPESDDPQRWRALDMLVAPLVDRSGRTRALLHLDEPVGGRRPPPAELQDVADRLELLLEAAISTVDREELTRQARLDETARSVVRAAASVGLTPRDLMTEVHFELAAGFRARALNVRLHGEPQPLGSWSAPAAELPDPLLPAIEAAGRRAWASRSVVIAEPGQVWGDDELDRDHRDDITAHLEKHDAGELLLVPVGAGPESMGVLVVARDGRSDRWTEGESTAALGVGHDLGRALLGTRAHEREQQLIEELQRLDHYRSQLIATVSHELKNPLGVIVGHVEMLESVAGLPQEAERSLAALGRSAGRLTSVVDDLLLLSRVSADEPLPRAAVDLRAVLTEVVEDESMHAAQQGVALRAPAYDDPFRVAGEHEELGRMLANLVSNAVKYSRSGGTVELSLERRGDEVVVRCTDDGLGISEEDRAQLFTEFFRSTNPEALRRPGTGLGLAIVSRIVARHCGRIDVDSELGVGTTFRVTLPVALAGGPT